MESGRPWRERKRLRDAGCGGEADPLFLPGWAHPLFLPGVAHPLFLVGWRGKQQGGEGGEGGGGGHPLFVPGEGDEQGKGEGREEMEWRRGLDTGRGRPSARLRRQTSGWWWCGGRHGKSR